jgi:hypothetical protein
VPELELPDDSDKSYLAEVMLEADAAHYEAQAVALMETLSAAVPTFLSAHNLEKFFPGKYRALVKRLLVSAVTAKTVYFLFEGEAANTREGAYAMAWSALGDEAVDVWKAYREENDALRLGFYATIEKQAKAKALPFLIDGLVYPKDPNHVYGFVTHAKYVARMVELVKKYDIAPHRERIETAFAGNSTKKIKEEIAKLLGKPSKAKPVSKKPGFAAKDGYRFDAHADAIVKVALAKLRKATLPEPIEQVKLGGMPEMVELSVIVIEGQGDTVEIELALPKSKVPQHVDTTGGDQVLPKFYKLHQLDVADDEAPSWGDMFKLPWCVLIHEQIGAAHEIVAALKKQGKKLAANLKVGVGEYDNFWQLRDGFDDIARGELAALPEDQQADFAAVCFESPKKRRWLLGK